MLKQRVITAVLLLAVLLPALFAPMAWPFALLTLLMIGAAAWEWARLNGVAHRPAMRLGALLMLACAAAWQAGWTARAPAAVWWLATLVWVLGGAAALRAGVAGWPRLAQGLRLPLGLLALGVAWLALSSAKAVGIAFILSVFCLAWAADIAAYFVGRRFGRRKLAPGISPGKSWEGVYSGMVGALLLAGLWWWLLPAPSLYGVLAERLGLAGMLLVVVFLAAMSVVGDLLESLVKRAAGAKDSSRLLPGHGGVLDRIDALLPVFPLAMAMVSL